MASTSNIISRYGLDAPAGFSELEQNLLLEIDLIRRGGTWIDAYGNTQGHGLIYHYKQACQLIWPHIDWHRWTELCNKEIRRPGGKGNGSHGAGVNRENRNCRMAILA